MVQLLLDTFIMHKNKYKYKSTKNPLHKINISPIINIFCFNYISKVKYIVIYSS